MAHSPSLLFITEVATKDIRGGLTAVATALASLGEGSIRCVRPRVRAVGIRVRGQEVRP